MTGTKTQLCTFFLDGHLFGIPVADIQEIIRYQELTPVPLAPSVIRGLINLRGRIVTAIDLRQRLGFAPSTISSAPMNVVVRTEDEVVSLLVDKIGDVIDVDDDRFEEPPETLIGSARGLILGAYKLDACLLLTLDTLRAVTL